MPLYKAVLALIIGAIMTLILITYASVHWVRVTQVSLKIPELPPQLDGLRILHLTDWHNRSCTQTHIDVLGAVRGTDFDLVCLTGDLVESHVTQLEPVKEVLARLGREAPVLSVLGNHDWSASGHQIIAELEEIGVASLENTFTRVDIRGASLTVVGISDFYSRRANVDAAFTGTGDDFTLVLTHDPSIFQQIAAHGPSLVLAGHTHGGQIRLPFLPTLYAPGQGFFPRYGDGLYWASDSTLYVSRGMGYTSILPFRFWNRPEITILTLHREDR